MGLPIPGGGPFGWVWVSPGGVWVPLMLPALEEDHSRDFLIGGLASTAPGGKGVRPHREDSRTIRKQT